MVQKQKDALTLHDQANRLACYMSLVSLFTEAIKICSTHFLPNVPQCKTELVRSLFNRSHIVYTPDKLLQWYKSSPSESHHFVGYMVQFHKVSSTA